MDTKTVPSPTPLRSDRHIRIVYQLSQEAQQDAWLNKVNSARVQYKFLRQNIADAETWKTALELMWISEGGDALVFVGGPEAFVSTNSGWPPKPVDSLVPGPWTVVQKEESGASHVCHGYPVEQSRVKPLQVDRYDLPVEDLIELEELRRYDIEKSKEKAEKEKEELMARIAEQQRRQMEIMLKTIELSLPSKLRSF